MKRFAARLLIILLLLATTAIAAAQSPTLQTHLISRAERGDEVHLAYGLEAADIPIVSVDHGRLISYAIVYDPSHGWRATVIAALDRCGGVLTAQAGTATQELARQRCTRFPVAPHGGTP